MKILKSISILVLLLSVPVVNADVGIGMSARSDSTHIYLPINVSTLSELSRV